jgi:hypothetical protein
MKMVFAILLMLTLTTAHSAEKQKTVPVRFLGEWNSNLKHCGYDAAVESGLKISPSYIEFYASAGPIHAIVTQGEYDLLIITELYGEEEETKLRFLHFRLSSDNESLADITGGASGVRFKCKKSN